MTDLPSGWAEAPLDDVCEILDFKRIPINSKERKQRIEGKSSHELFPYYGATGQVDVIDGYLFEGRHVLIGEDGAPFLDPIKPKAYMVDGRFWVNNHAHILRALGDNRYLCHYLNFIRYEDHVTGTTRLKLTKSALVAIPILVPPLNEQRRIVEKIEAMFDEIDAGVQSLQAARATLGLYRQSLLKSAFEGRLTADWRARNADKLEAPETLLARIQAERDARYKAALDTWQDALAQWRADGEKGKKPAKPKRPKDISDLAKSKKSNGFWPTLELGDIVHVSSGNGLTSKDMKKGPYPVYGGNGINGYHDEYFLEEEELIIGRVGAKCGVTHIARPKSWVTDNALIVTPLVTSFDKHFFKRLLETKDLNRLGSSTGQPVISGSKIYPVTLELPSIAEQTEIVRILDARLDAADALEAEIDAALTRADALRQSILKKAFSGQLVPQNPEDEPASTLLERIKVEKKERENSAKEARKSRPVRVAEPRRPTMTDLLDVLKQQKSWIPASKAAEGLGLGDGASSDDIQAFYHQLKQYVESSAIEIERRGDEDWLCVVR